MVIMAVAVVEAIIQLIMVILSCTHKRAVDSFYVISASKPKSDSIQAMSNEVE